MPRMMVKDRVKKLTFINSALCAETKRLYYDLFKQTSNAYTSKNILSIYSGYQCLKILTKRKDTFINPFIAVPLYTITQLFKTFFELIKQSDQFWTKDYYTIPEGLTYIAFNKLPWLFTTIEDSDDDFTAAKKMSGIAVWMLKTLGLQDGSLPIYKMPGMTRCRVDRVDKEAVRLGGILTDNFQLLCYFKSSIDFMLKRISYNKNTHLVEARTLLNNAMENWGLEVKDHVRQDMLMTGGIRRQEKRFLTIYEKFMDFVREFIDHIVYNNPRFKANKERMIWENDKDQV